MGYTAEELNVDIKGADEIDIVYSALDEIMSTAVKENWAFAIRKNLNFRDACLANTIQKLVQHYKEVGITV